MTLLKKIKKKICVIMTFCIIYFISFWLLTIGYFTPNWLMIDMSSGDFDIVSGATTVPWKPWQHGSSCNSIGLVKPTHNCDENVFDLLEDNNVRDIKRILGNTFILMTTAVVVVYTNAMLLMTAIVFDLFRYSLYMSFLSISFGVFYPMAAVLILVATIYVEASYTSDTGFSPMLCTISGCLMILLYISLIVYDKKYMKSSTASEIRETKFKSSAGGKIKGIHPASFETKLKRNDIRNFGLRRA